MPNKGREYIWRIPRDECMCFGFEDPEKPHILKWTCIDVRRLASKRKNKRFAALEIDGMGSSSILTLVDGRQIMCQIKAEHSTKVIEFSDWIENDDTDLISEQKTIITELQTKLKEEKECKSHDDEEEDDDFVSMKLRLDLVGLAISFVDNASEALSDREILYFQSESWLIEFSQIREGYHEIEIRLMSFQVDNHVAKKTHPVLVSIAHFIRTYNLRGLQLI